VLLSGAGGGFDVYSAVPLMALLEARGVRVTFGNLSFTHLDSVSSQRCHESIWHVLPNDSGPDYFPERTLARWLQGRGAPHDVYAFPRTGVAPLRDAYQHLVDTLKIDAVVLVDGGTDSLLRGHESDLGTPIEDVTSIAAVHGIKDIPRLLCSIGFGVDSYHGVAHAEVLEAVADYTRHDGFLGVCAVLPGMPESEAYLDAVAHANADHPQASIVATSVASAIQGHFGDHHAISRTRGSELWINPLMAMYWAFTVDVIAERNQYIRRIMGTRTVPETVEALYAYRDSILPPPKPRIPS
jgi:hypothetical protein